MHNLIQVSSINDSLLATHSWRKSFPIHIAMFFIEIPVWHYNVLTWTGVLSTKYDTMVWSKPVVSWHSVFTVT